MKLYGEIEDCATYRNDPSEEGGQEPPDMGAAPAHPTRIPPQADPDDLPEELRARPHITRIPSKANHGYPHPSNPVQRFEELNQEDVHPRVACCAFADWCTHRPCAKRYHALLVP